MITNFQNTITTAIFDDERRNNVLFSTYMTFKRELNFQANETQEHRVDALQI